MSGLGDINFEKFKKEVSSNPIVCNKLVYLIQKVG